jgi:RNA polymerase sigma-70 factor (ECF subfamily)
MRALAVLATVGPLPGPEERARTVAAAKAGDLAAFELLMRQHERLVLATALRILGNLTDAQDASQEVFLKLYRNLGRVESAGGVSSWLYRVTVNVCHDLRRRRPASPSLDSGAEGAAEVPASGCDPLESVSEAERRRALELSLRLLSEKERAALVLRDLEGLSTRDVARILGSTEATVRSQISKGRIKVRTFVERYFRRKER